KPKLYAHPDPQMPGHYIRVSPIGNKVYVAVARDPNGKQIWTTIGNVAHLKIDPAREKAREIITAVKGGQRVGGPQSFESVTQEWIKRHVHAKGLISGHNIERNLRKHVLPAWGGRDFISIKRGDVAALLDTIEDGSGPVAADTILAHLGSLFNWYT